MKLEAQNLNPNLIFLSKSIFLLLLSPAFHSSHFSKTSTSNTFQQCVALENSILFASSAATACYPTLNSSPGTTVGLTCLLQTYKHY
jgi:predicted membrane channel-forming protein YqfA (hemolysin III family)